MKVWYYIWRCLRFVSGYKPVFQQDFTTSYAAYGGQILMEVK